MNKRKTLFIPIEVGYRNHPTQRALRIHIPPPYISETCVCLQLLLQQLVDSFVFKYNQREEAIEFKLGMQTQVSLHATTRAAITLSLSTNDLSIFQDFLLTYFRDDTSPVDHLDFQTADCDLIISIDERIAPFSTLDSKRRLGW